MARNVAEPVPLGEPGLEGPMPAHPKSTKGRHPRLAFQRWVAALATGLGYRFFSSTTSNSKTSVNARP